MFVGKVLLILIFKFLGFVCYSVWVVKICLILFVLILNVIVLNVLCVVVWELL